MAEANLELVEFTWYYQELQMYLYITVPFIQSLNPHLQKVHRKIFHQKLRIVIIESNT